MATPQIPPYTGNPPNRATDSQVDFSNNVDDTLLYMLGIPSSYNTLADFVNDKAADAEAAAIAAAAAVNFEGNWSDLTGDYNAGISVLHTDTIWLLLVNLADITLSEPTAVNTDWKELPSLSQQDANTADIAQNKLDIDNAYAKNLLSGDQNFNAKGDDLVFNPDATPRTYSIGESFTYTRKVIDSDIVNATYVNGIFSADSGSYYQEIDGEFPSALYGVKLQDNTYSTTGCSLSVSAGKTRITVDMSIAPSHKFAFIKLNKGLVNDVSDDESINDIYVKMIRERTRVDYTLIKAVGVTYTNIKSHPITLQVWYLASGSGGPLFIINGELVAPSTVQIAGASAYLSCSVDIESGATYRVDGNFSKWFEVR